ncbi:MAG: hypothetical protein ACRDZO_05785 [Egibacteraceae bacterium]
MATRTWVDLRAGIDDGVHELVRAVNGSTSRAVVSHGEEVCPYRGLEVFEEQHARFFFGREHDTARVIAKLGDSRFLAVLGPSGCGKSSLVRAGVVPALERLAGSRTVRVLAGHTGPIYYVAVSADGKTIASSSFQEQAVRIWDVPSRTTKDTITFGVGAPGGVAISPDGRMLASGGLDRSLLLWGYRDLAKGRLAALPRRHP